MRQSRSLRGDIVAVCRRLYERGLIAGPDGNVSVRLAADRILVTPSGISKVDLEEADLVELSLEGTKLSGDGSPSSEVAMHLRAYRVRADVAAVVHAHPPVATGFSVAGEGITAGVLPEVILQMGTVPLVPYATPGTESVPDAMAPFLPNHDAFLLANHGATTLGRTVAEAHQRMESLEHAARILLTARVLGRVNALDAPAVAALERGRSRPVRGADPRRPS
jgi:L-fuculose-phosphate aldolase